jgi:hypothetical protein
MSAVPQIVLSAPKITFTEDSEAFQHYVIGMNKLWENGRPQRSYVSMPLETFKRGYFTRAYQIAKGCTRKKPIAPYKKMVEQLTSNKNLAYDWRCPMEELVKNVQRSDYTIHNFPLDQVEKKYYGLVDPEELDLCVQIMRSLLEGVNNDNPKGTHENYECLGFELIEMGSLPPLPVVRFSDGGDWDDALEGFHYPKSLPDGTWTIDEYIPFTDNALMPENITWGYDEEFEPTQWFSQEDREMLGPNCDEIIIEPTCNEYELVFTTGDTPVNPQEPLKGLTPQ